MARYLVSAVILAATALLVACAGMEQNPHRRDYPNYERLSKGGS